MISSLTHTLQTVRYLSDVFLLHGKFNFYPHPLDWTWLETERRYRGGQQRKTAKHAPAAVSAESCLTSRSPLNRGSQRNSGNESIPCIREGNTTWQISLLHVAPNFMACTWVCTWIKSRMLLVYHVIILMWYHELIKSSYFMVIFSF